MSHVPFKWVKDQKVEANLRALGIPFSIERVKLADVDLQAGLRNQARLVGKLNDEYVLQLGVQMAVSGAAFPMTILQKFPHGKSHIPESGNHRLAAFTLTFPEQTEIEAYVIHLTDPRMLDILPRVVNAWESGLGFSKEEKIINARWLVEHHSMTQAEAATLLGIKYEWLVVAKRVEDVRKELMELGPRASSIPQSTLLKMAPLADNVNVLKAVARMMTVHGIVGDDAKHMIADVKRGKTEAQQMAEIARWEQVAVERNRPKEKRIKKSQTVRLSRVVRDSFIKYLTGLARVLDKADTLEKLQCTDPADKELIVRHWPAIVRVMNAVLKGGAA